MSSMRSKYTGVPRGCRCAGQVAWTAHSQATTQSSHALTPSPDLLERNFTADGACRIVAREGHARCVDDGSASKKSAARSRA